MIQLAMTQKNLRRERIKNLSDTESLYISLSREHGRFQDDVKNSFGRLDVVVRADYMRFSEGDLPMQVIIFLGSAFVGGAAWDLLKLGIKNLHQKFKKVNVSVRDTESIMYSILPNGTVRTIVVPEREQEFVEVKTLDDLITRLKNQRNRIDGWQAKKLSEVFDIKPPKKEAKERLGNDDLVSFAPMKDLGILTKDLLVTKERKLKEVFGGYTYFADNDVLLAKITPCFENGKLGIAKKLRNGIGFGSSEYIVFRSKGGVLPDYLFYFLSNDEFRDEGRKRMSGAVGHKRVSKDFIESYLIPYPKALAEQKRIVKKLDEIFGSLAEVKKNAERNFANSHKLFESYLQEIFANPRGDWEICELNDYVKFIDYRGRTPKKTASGLRLITAKNIKMGFLQRNPAEFIDPKDYESWMTRGIPQKGDILFTTEAPMAMVAQLDTDEKVAFAQRTIAFQADPKRINSTFLKYLLMSSPIQKRIIQKGTGATVQGIKASLLKKIEIYFPKSLFEQKAIVKKLDALSTETKKLEATYKQKLADLEELRKSVLARAFSGEL